MTPPKTAAGLLTRASIEASTATEFRHPLNPAARRLTRSLGDAAGLQRLGVHLVELQPGQSSTEYHFHHTADEFAYIVSGRGVAELGGAEYEIGAGDFLGFPAGGVPHALRNPFDEALVYLVGGDRTGFDICDYPRAGQRLIEWYGEEQWLPLPAERDRSSGGDGSWTRRAAYRPSMEDESD